MGHLHLQHHDGYDDCKHSVAERFQPALVHRFPSLIDAMVSRCFTPGASLIVASNRYAACYTDALGVYPGAVTRRQRGNDTANIARLSHTSQGSLSRDIGVEVLIVAH